jgi:NAD(P)-dependent dehydrogenase (short-subunit alcohol dehydrogenase family)
MTPHGSRPVKKRRRALVTGGAVRVGRVIALALAREAFDVVIGYHHSAREAERTLRELSARGSRAAAIRADLASPAEARRLVGEAVRRLGGLDVLVNNAAVFFRTPFLSVTPAAYDRFLDVNLRGAFFCAQAAAAAMARGGGRIVNIADVAGQRAWPGYVPYTLSKAGVVALTRALAVALRTRHVAVNCVAPGPVLRPRGFPLARWNAVTRGRPGTPEDVAAAVTFFATCPRYITGQILFVDGGQSV